MRGIPSGLVEALVKGYESKSLILNIPFPGDRLGCAYLWSAAVGHPERDGGVQGEVRHHAQGRRFHEELLHGELGKEKYF